MTDQTIRHNFVRAGQAVTVKDCNVKSVTIDQGLSTVRYLSVTQFDNSTELSVNIASDIDRRYTEDEDDKFATSWPHKFVPEDKDIDFIGGGLKNISDAPVSESVYMQDLDIFAFTVQANTAIDETVTCLLEVDEMELRWSIYREDQGNNIGIVANDKYVFDYTVNIVDRIDIDSGEIVPKNIREELDSFIRDLDVSEKEIYLVADGILYIYDIEDLELLYEHDKKYASGIGELIYDSDSDLVIIEDNDDILHAFDANDRTDAWENDSFDRTSTTKIVDGRLYVLDGGDNIIYEVDKDNGDIAWEFTEDPTDSGFGDISVYGDSVIGLANTGRDDPSGLFSIDIDSKDIEWETELGDIERNDYRYIRVDNDDILAWSDGIDLIKADTGEIKESAMSEIISTNEDVIVYDDTYWLYDRIALVGTEFDKALKLSEVIEVYDYDSSSPSRTEMSEFIYNEESALLALKDYRGGYTINTVLGINPVVSE